MVIDFDYDPEENYVRAKASGDLLMEDFIIYFDALKKMPVKPGFRSLVDFTRATATFSAGELSLLKDQGMGMMDLFGARRSALVVGDGAAADQTLLYKMLIPQDIIHVEIFTRVEDAEAWLDQDEDRD